MCHDIEDLTFDATAVATNPKADAAGAPAAPAPRGPAAALRVDGDDRRGLPAVEPIPALAVNARSHAANVVLDPIDPADVGNADYRGDLLSDVDFMAFALCPGAHRRRGVPPDAPAQPVLRPAVTDRALTRATTRRIALSQLVGHAGITAERLHCAPDRCSTSARARRTPRG